MVEEESHKEMRVSLPLSVQAEGEPYIYLSSLVESRTMSIAQSLVEYSGICVAQIDHWAVSSPSLNTVS